MADLLHIGRSGLVSYRTALSVTSENIANANTEGYRRRDTVMAEMGGAPGAPTIRGQLPAGVDVADVRRAFDSLLADRTRSAQSSLGTAETFLTHVTALENRLLPGDGGIPDLLDNFFDSLDGLSSSPADTGLRQVVLNEGAGLAGGIASLAKGLTELNEAVATETSMTVDSANALLEDLGRVQRDILQVPDSIARNPLMDQRDQMLLDLSKITGLHVSLDDMGMATARFGGANGPVILSGARFGRLEQTDSSRLAVYSTEAGAPPVMRTPTDGALNGLASASGAITQAITDINAWAAGLADEMNALHAQGLNMNGEPGGDMFTLAGWSTDEGALNRGDAAVSAVITNASVLPDGPLEMVFDASAGYWSVTDPAGTELAQGIDALTLPGLRLEISGTPADGDRLSLNRTLNDARNMAFVPVTTNEIAAAGALQVSALPGSSGSATLTAAAQTPVSSGQQDLSGLLNNEPVEFLTNGLVGMIPAGSETAVLSAQPRNAELELSVPAGAALRSLTLVQDGTTHEFTIPAGMDTASLTQALNDGTLQSTDRQSFAELGLVADSGAGTFNILAQSGATLPSAHLSTDMGGINGVVVADASDAADLSVFTRDGRQLSGPPLSPTEVTALLTPENGFYPDAEYSTEFLNASSGFGALEQARTGVAGDYTALLGQNGAIASWTGQVAAPAAPATDITFDGADQSLNLTLPAGSSAAWQADLISENLPISADAETRVMVDVPATGTLTMRVAGDNTTPLLISANLANGGPVALAQAINAQTGGTGIRAELSSDNNRLVLVHDGGADITLSQVAHSTGGQIGVTRLGPDGAALGGQTVLGTGADDAARISGTIQLSGAVPYGVGENGVLQTATQDPFENGLISRSISQAGSAQSLTFATPVAGDITLRELAITASDGSVLEVAIPPVEGDGSQMAVNMAAALRESAPASQMVGAPLANLPPLGAQMVVSLGEQDYTIRMEAGGPTVTGPEAGRVAASFDDQNRLVLSTNGGHLDGAALQLPADAGEAARFGMGMTDSPMTTVIGAPFDAGSLPASLTVRLGGTDYSISVSSGSVVMPATFPGTGYINTTYGRIEIQFDARAGDLEIPPQSGAADAGFNTIGAQASVANGVLTLEATDGRALDVNSTPAGNGVSLTLNNLPNEELLVFMGGAGAARLSGDITQSTTPDNSAKEVRVLNADTREVGLYDFETGAFLASRTLDEAGHADFGSLAVTLAGALTTGDAFSIAPNTNGGGDARTAESLANLRTINLETGQGGYSSAFAQIQAVAGSHVSAGESRLQTAETVKNSADKAESKASAVDLDTEAARLMQYQQAYQANAQVMSVARELFQTLLNSL